MAVDLEEHRVPEAKNIRLRPAVLIITPRGRLKMQGLPPRTFKQPPGPIIRSAEPPPI